jgi:DNA topoisomerase IB
MGIFNSWFKGSQAKPIMPLPAELPAMKSLNMASAIRPALAGAFPGAMWISDHRTEAEQNTGWNHIAINAICQQLASATVTAYEDGSNQVRNQSRRKSLRNLYGTISNYKAQYGQDDDETRPLDNAHALMKLLQKPNPFEPGSMFRYRQAQQLRLTGTNLVWNVPSLLKTPESPQGLPCQRYVVPIAMTTAILPSEEMPYGGYRIIPNTSRQFLLDKDGYQPGSPIWSFLMGVIIDARHIQKIGYPHGWRLDDFWSPVSAGSKWIDGANAVDSSRFAQMKNGADPSVQVELSPGINPTQDEMDRVSAKASKKYGGPDNAGSIWFTENGTVIHPLSTSPKDMNYKEGFQDFKEAILALHSTPPTACGIIDVGTTAGWLASMRGWSHAAIKPMCRLLADSDTHHLAPQFGEGITVEIEPEEINDEVERNARCQVAISAKSISKNTLNATLGFKLLEGSEGDKLAGPDAPQPGQGGNPTAKPESGSLTDLPSPSDPGDAYSGNARGETTKSLQAVRDGMREADDEYIAEVVERAVAAKLKSMGEPSAAQREAGNYKKTHITIQGLRISIENPKGSIRSGTSRQGQSWSIEMANDYGYIKGTESGADGDHIDVFIGPNPESELVFIVDQVNPDSGDFDEHKVILGSDSKAEAKQIYFANYSKGWKGFGDITPMHIDDFKEWLKAEDSSKPVGDIEPRKSGESRFITFDDLKQFGKSLGMSTSNGSDGGFTVPEESQSAIKDRQEIADGQGYGKCPMCGAEAVSRNRGMGTNQNDTCRNGHVYLSDMTIVNQPKESAEVPIVEQSVEPAKPAKKSVKRRKPVLKHDVSGENRDHGKFAVTAGSGKKPNENHLRIESGHVVPENTHVDVAGTTYHPGEFIHSHQVSSLTPEERSKNTESLGGKKMERIYRNADTGEGLSSEHEAEVRGLKIRPDLKNVTLMKNDHGELKGYGTDSKGRRQPIYPAAHTERAKAAKFERLKEFQSSIGKIRERLASDLNSPDEKTREGALLARLIEKTGMRVGSDKDTGAEKKATGATTLEPQHVKIDGNKVTMEFVGKSGHDNHWELNDPVIAKAFKNRIEQGKSRLFSINDTQFRDYMHDVAPGFKAAKDFRTAAAAEHAISAVDGMKEPTTATEYREALGKVAAHVSGQINNTPDVAFNSYIPPEVFGQWQANLLSKGIDVTGLKPSYPKATSMVAQSESPPMKEKIGGKQKKPKNTNA